jgi:glycosyltransferase involved in cell wall biosynthesis
VSDGSGPRAPDLSLVVPCYEEAEHLRGSVAAVLATLDATRIDYELVFVDDASHDETRAILSEICAAFPRCRALFHATNRGRGAAFKSGFAASRGRVTGFLDIDLEVAAHYIPPLFARVDRDGFDVATGYRHYLLRQTRAFHRHVASRGYRVLCRALLGAGIRDSETGCKFFRRETAASVVLASRADGWFWDTEVMMRAVLSGLRIVEVPVLFLRRIDKTSTVRMGRDILAYWRELRRFRAEAGLALGGRSPVYWSTAAYEGVMRLLYGRAFAGLYADIAARIPDGASVLDVCAGPATLWQHALRGRKIRYLALDANARFVLAARRRGADARCFDLRREALPEADYVVLASSLYQFRPAEASLLERLRRAARRAVIVSEPVANLASRGPRVWRALVARLTDPGDGAPASRFDAETFRDLAERQGAVELVQEAGARNALAVFEGCALQDAEELALPAG